MFFLNGLLTTVVIGSIFWLIYLMNKDLLQLQEMDGSEILIKTQLKLANEIYVSLIEDEKDANLFVSPISIHIILMMLYMASNGETKLILENRLKIDEENVSKINSRYKELLENFKKLKSSDFSMLNTAYLAQHLTLNSAFEHNIEDIFKANFKSINFSDSDCIEQINDEISEKTNGTFRKMFDYSDFNELVQFVFVNSMYFDQKWMIEFDKSKTFASEFHLSDGRTILTTMMNIKQKFFVLFETPLNADLLVLPYRDNVFKMVVLLPSPDTGLHDFEASLDLNVVFELLGQTQLKEVNVFLPKFKIENTFELNNALKKIGYQVLFNETCNLSNLLSDNRSLFVSKIVQKTFVKIDEAGSVASTVTHAKISVRSIREQWYFEVNRPFMFLILETKSNSVMFMGRVHEPIEDQTTSPKVEL